MKLAEMNWMQVEQYLTSDDRIVVALGSTEQHAYLSLSVDSILSERVSVDAAEPLRVPVLPAVPFGMTPYFSAFPGTISLRVETYIALIRDILESLEKAGFKRILMVNGHGGNSPIMAFVLEWAASRPHMQCRLHNWWNAPKTLAKVNQIDSLASHASWMENLPWTRLANVTMPDTRKPMIDLDKMRLLPPEGVRELIGDGNFGGSYQRPDEDVLALWDVAVAETRELLENGWR